MACVFAHLDCTMDRALRSGLLTVASSSEEAAMNSLAAPDGVAVLSRGRQRRREEVLASAVLNTEQTGWTVRGVASDEPRGCGFSGSTGCRHTSRNCRPSAPCSSRPPRSSSAAGSRALGSLWTWAGRTRTVNAPEVRLTRDHPVTGACLVGAVVQAGGGPAAVRSQPVQRALDLIWHSLREDAEQPVRWCPGPPIRTLHVLDLTHWNERLPTAPAATWSGCSGRPWRRPRLRGSGAGPNWPCLRSRPLADRAGSTRRRPC